MASYQDIETRLQQVERKVEFVMKAFAVVEQGNPFARPHTLLDEYYKSLTKPAVFVTDLPSEDEQVVKHTDNPDGTIDAEVVNV
mgnify:CR=1 FL=1